MVHTYNKAATYLAFRSFLQVMKTRGATAEEVAKEMIDALGIVFASEVAYQINELEKSIPWNNED